MKWLDAKDAPLEKKVLTYWPGNGRRKPEYLVNTRRDPSAGLGTQDWWCSKPDRQPTHYAEFEPPNVNTAIEGGQ